MSLFDVASQQSLGYGGQFLLADKLQGHIIEWANIYSELDAVPLLHPDTVLLMNEAHFMKRYKICSKERIQNYKTDHKLRDVIGKNYHMYLYFIFWTAHERK